MSKEKQLYIAPNFSIPANDYANQANAILGIRDAGKTYTAMKAAEELLDCDIPIVVFDPVGVWKNLKIGVGKHKGYPIVVAGGEGADIRLTKENAVDIVRAAMKENVSLVIDLYSPELINKATWIAIVQSTVDLLMYENKSYGLRHIFIEEAAEFIPQKLQPQHAKVYASLERLARMGRNAKLGMTIINQRAEEVNKAILEICDLSLVHKQVGKNSMLSIQKWFEVRQLDNVKEIIKSLPQLNKGECWAVGLTDQPLRIQVAKKNTFHPNPKANEKETSIVTTLKRDVGEFVDKLKQQLEKEQEKKKPVAKPVTPQKLTNTAVSLLSGKEVNQIENLKAEVIQLKNQVKIKDGEILWWKKLAVARGVQLNKIHSLSVVEETQPPVNGSTFASDIKEIANSVNKIAPKANLVAPRPVVVSSGNGTVGKCSREVIKFLAQFSDRQFSKAQVAIATGYSAGSGGFNNALSELNQKGFILRNGKLQVNSDALEEIVRSVGEIQQQDYNIETYKNNLGKCEREIYEVLLQHPDRFFSKDELSQSTETTYSANSGGFNNSLSRLNTLELIERQNGQIRLNPELLELMA